MGAECRGSGNRCRRRHRVHHPGRDGGNGKPRHERHPRPHERVPERLEACCGVQRLARAPSQPNGIGRTRSCCCWRSHPRNGRRHCRHDAEGGQAWRPTQGDRRRTRYHRRGIPEVGIHRHRRRSGTGGHQELDHQDADGARKRSGRKQGIVRGIPEARTRPSAAWEHGPVCGIPGRHLQDPRDPRARRQSEGAARHLRQGRRRACRHGQAQRRRTRAAQQGSSSLHHQGGQRPGTRLPPGFRRHAWTRLRAHDDRGVRAVRADDPGHHRLAQGDARHQRLGLLRWHAEPRQGHRLRC